MEKGYAVVNGARLYYEAGGPSSAQPLVLIHGFSLDTRMWDSQWEVLSHEYRMVRYDLRGFGKSSQPDPAIAYRHMDDLKALLDHLSIPQAHLLGLSLGSAVATEMALAYPSCVSALIAADPVLWGYNWSQDTEAEQVWAAGRSGDLDTARALWLAHPLFAPALKNSLSSAPLTQIVNDYSGWHWVNKDPNLLPGPLAITALEEITAPALVVIGEHDLPDHQAIARTLHNRLPNARLVTIPGVGHMSNMEAPAEFNEAALTFLASLKTR